MDRRTDILTLQVILYSVERHELHWTDTNVVVRNSERWEEIQRTKHCDSVASVK